MLNAASRMEAGLHAVAVTGTYLTAADQQDLLGTVDQARSLMAAMGEGIERARAEGVVEFAPDSSIWVRPTGITDDQIKGWFSGVVGHPYSEDAQLPGQPAYGPLLLTQWSRAIDALEDYIARETSRLPPGAGGGAQQAGGAWYVNGERFSLAELFVAVRMGNVANSEKEIESTLNTMVAKAALARQQLALLSSMKLARSARSAEPQLAYTQDTKGNEVLDTSITYPQFDPDADFAQLAAARGIALSDLRRDAIALKGEGSLIAKAVDLHDRNDPGLSSRTVESITTVSSSPTLLRITTAGSHGLLDGDRILLADVEPAEFNGLFKVTGTSGSATEFEIQLPTAVTAAGPATAPGRWTASIDPVDYGTMLEELQALFDSVNADNAVQRMRVQSTQNAQSAQLASLSAFLSGYYKQNTLVRRNL